MADKTASIKWFLSQTADVRYLPEPPLPIRSDYKSAEELHDLAEQMAKTNDIALPEYEPFEFSKRLKENAKLILHAFRATDAAARNNDTITPAAQWLLDNHYTIDKTVQQARRDFPKAFIKQLPIYVKEPAIPRIFALAWLYVAHCDSLFSLKTLTSMVQGFQKVETLQIGELWALPSAVRLVMIENARRLSLRIERARRMRQYANQVADMIALAKDENALEEILSTYKTLTSDVTFSTHLLYRLRGASIDSTVALAWLEEQLRFYESTPEEATSEEHTRQSTGGVTMGNIIRSLKAIDDVDWTSWFETVSHVDAMLRDNSDFAQIDFHSRNAYRVVIEKIARRSDLNELDVARKAINMANSHQHQTETYNNNNNNQQHGVASVAWYLVGDGHKDFEQACGYNQPFSSRLIDYVHKGKIWSIATPVTIITIAIILLVFVLLRACNVKTTMTFIFALLSIFPAMDTAYAFFNLIISWFVPPSRLIGYEYKDGIPANAKTLVVVPTLITSRDVIDEQIRNLEVHYLSNTRGEIYFALATDWSDSNFEETEEDLDLYHYAQNGIKSLNRHYRGDAQPLFFLLHRHRLFNQSEGCWMGWERKRGKLHELNLLLRGDQDTSYFPPDQRLPMDCRFIMTLDSDTRLTPEAVTKLVGKLNHPLNRPVIDPVKKIVTSGHAILQPRVTPSLTTGHEASFLQRIFSINRGLDPYVFAISDTYQDLLNEGTFTGKGLYDLDAFEAAMVNKVHENSVLSHDLLEGGYARAALVTDVEVVEDYPTAYNVDVARHHRWTRGDWQLIPYLFTYKNISLTTRWKMQDNLRRSLTPLFWLIASVTGWCFLPLQTALYWQIFLLVGQFMGPTLSVLRNLMPTSMDNALRGHAQSIITNIATGTADILLRTTFLAYSAYFMVDAIIRTLYRLFISHKNLLEWKTSASTKSIPNSLIYYIITMWPASLIGLFGIILPSILHNSAIFVALPFALSWIFSPFIAWLVSRPDAVQDSLDLRNADKYELRRIARRTWHYYESFTNKENNYLPPDNFQEDPYPVVAQRTSPTNIGVYLLSIVAARDFGWISFNDAILRIEQTLSSVKKLEKHRGHLYNWYETHNLRPLFPTYVSTVDSGNFAGHLVTLSSALKQWAEAPSVFLQGNLEGLLDVSNILVESLKNVPDDRRVLRPLRRRIESNINNFQRAVYSIISEPETITLRSINLPLAALDILRLIQEIHKEINSKESSIVVKWAECLLDTCNAHNYDANGEHDADRLRAKLSSLAVKARKFAFDMKFDFLERKERRLLSIGYRVQENELDESCYDLLASEARLSSLFAIAKGDIKVEHWFRLGRMLIPVGWKGALLSWSGSMFEYLMPPLVMREPLGSLLDQTNRLIVRSQIQYANQRGLPWGISEAAFNTRDQNMNYQYSNFGVPKLGLQRGLSRNAVIAPYASILAAQYEPHAAIMNLKRLRKLGALGEYGFHDSIDFTPSRLREGEKYAVIRNYYAHHHGMSILAINNVIFEGRMRNLFHSDPVIEAAELLLQEKAPREIPLVHAKTANPMRSDSDNFEDAPMRIIPEPLLKPRASVILSNGAYSTMLTANGSGYSRWHDYAITRFMSELSEDQQGTFFFLRDTETWRWWSATGEPTRVVNEDSVCVFTDEKAEYIKTVDGIKSVVECIVASEGDGEGRRIELINTTDRDRIIEITSYAELVLTTADNDSAHPVFSRMFVDTEIADQGSTIFAKRRKRAPKDPEIHVAHFVTDAAGVVRDCEAETDRRLFLGRGRSMRRPAAFDRDAHLHNSQGCVLDPVATIRCRVRVPAHKKADLIFWTFAADSKEKLQNNIDHYRQPNIFEREFSMAWTRSQVSLYQIGIKPSEAIDYQRFATALIYPNRAWRLAPETLAESLGKQADLWPMAISGDYPIFLLRVDNEGDLAILRDLLKAHEYWRIRGLRVDVVILNERAFSYAQDTQRAIEWMCEAYRNKSAEADGKQHIFTIRRDQISDQSCNTLLAAARIVLHAQNGPLSEQLKRIETIDLDLTNRNNPNINSASAENNTLTSANTTITADINLNKNSPRKTVKKKRNQNLLQGRYTSIGIIGDQHRGFHQAEGDNLDYWNGYGGFDKDNSYVIRLAGRTATPHPWINVIANKDFGFHISAEGAAFTWAGNSRDYQLTPWTNDPVLNRPGEALYIVDQISLKRFSPVSSVECNEEAIYDVRHGFGYSTFSSKHNDIALELTHTVDIERPIRLSRLIIKNEGTSVRSLRLYNYAEWVLGTVRAKNAPFIIPAYDEKRGTLFVKNPFHNEKNNQVSFLSASMMPSSVTADRAEFIGQTGTIKHPLAIRNGEALSNTVEAGRDPCSALAYDIELNTGASTEIIFYLGNAQNQNEAEKLLDSIRNEDFNKILATQKDQWTNFTSGLQVNTPDKGFNVLINGWLPYQAYACRIMARAAYYQASGAYGFRDQLQDSLSMLLLKPELARDQLRNAAARQFLEGDVQHWWLPATGAGVRTLISDDVAWLAYGAAHYAKTTGDYAFLDEEINFIDGEPLKEGQHDSYFQPAISPKKASLYEHCVLALDLAIKRIGKHNLPLILGGDWNDGMNLVGVEGKGESIWLAWFLGNALKSFIPIGEMRGDEKNVKKWQAHIDKLTKALEEHGWDGAWYRRGYFDDGMPLGSHLSDECKIDTIAQSWSVLADMAPIKRQKQAMQSMLKHLGDEQGGLIRLFWPPFNNTDHEPGYIKGYPPGLRENGGQYTHGAIWSILALAALGEHDKAYEVFSMISPISHGNKPETYRVEPYVIAADIYSVEPRRGQGGWTWYTGSAGWYYRAATEAILGIKRQGNKLLLEPALPSSWPGFEATLKFEKASYKIKVIRSDKASLTIDSKKIIKSNAAIDLKTTGKHEIILSLKS